MTEIKKCKKSIITCCRLCLDQSDLNYYNIYEDNLSEIISNLFTVSVSYIL